jgi:pentatricopeptide repeat protein
VSGEVETVPAAAEDHYADALRRFRGDVRMMEQVLATMIERGEPRSEVHLGLMLDEYLGARSLRKARAIIGQLDELGVALDPRRRFDVALAIVASGSADEGLALVDQLVAEQRDPAPDQAARVLDLLVGAGRVAPAWSLFRRMRARGQEASRDVHLALLADCVARKAAKDAVLVVQAMTAASHLVPGSRASALVRGLCAGGQVERALEIVTLVDAAAAGVPDARGIDAETHGVLLRALARRGHVDQVVALATRLTPSDGPAPAYLRDVVLAARITTGDLEGAWVDAEAMWADASVPSVANLEALLDAELAADHSVRATGLLDLLLLLGATVTPQRSGAVLRATMATSGVDLALPLATVLLDRELTFDRSAARDLVERLVRARRLDEARAWLTRFRRGRTLTQGRSYTSLISALVAAKRIDDAVAVLEEMAAGGVTPEAADLTRLVAARLKADDLARSDRLVEAAERVGVALDEAVLRELMWAHARRGDLPAVERTIARIVAGGHAVDERHEKARAWASGETPRRLEDTPGGDGTGEVVAAAVPPSETESSPEPDAPSVERG